MDSPMLVFYAGAVTIVAVGMGLEVMGRRALTRRRRADMIAAALREEEMKSTENAILREKLQDEAILHGRIQNSPIDYFEMGRKLAARPAVCLFCQNGAHNLYSETVECSCPCHEKVPA